MSPSALRAAHETSFAKIHVLMAWDDEHHPRRLIGLWALQERRTWRFGPVVLDALPFEYAFLSKPVVDTQFEADVMAAFMAALAQAKHLPRLIALPSMSTLIAGYEPMLTAVRARGGAVATVSTQQRPVLFREDYKPSGERRRKMRQSWKRLATQGVVDLVFAKDPADIGGPLETFFDLEFKSWKGANGTALLCREADAAFVRTLVRRLAETNQAAIESLTLDGVTIATQVILRSGSMCYTWKTAYDHAYGRYSPGLLLVDKLTERVFSLPEMDGLDSCSVERSFMAELWHARQPIADILIDNRAGLSPVFMIEAARQIGREKLKQLRDRLVDAREARRKAKAVAEAARAAAAQAASVAVVEEVAASAAADTAAAETPKKQQVKQQKKQRPKVAAESSPFHTDAPGMTELAAIAAQQTRGVPTGADSEKVSV
jgi:hypothetical protein